MRVNICLSEDTWVLSYIAKSIRLPNVTHSFNTPDLTADINFYVNYFSFQKPLAGTFHIPWFTHIPHPLDDDGRRINRFFTAVADADCCIAMCRKTAEGILTRFPTKPVFIWGGAPDAAYVKEKLVLGISGKISRRKRPDRIEALKQIPGVEVRVSGGKLSFDEMRKWYQSLDYLVVTSDTEGGPYPVMEAIAAGVPVIAPDVGWCWDYPVIRYTGTDELISTVTRLKFPPDPWGESSKELEMLLCEIWQLHRTTVSTFRYKETGPQLTYYFHSHNCGKPNDKRRTERTVEISLANFWLDLVKQQQPDAKLTEIGAVTPYYTKAIKDVVDPADNKGTIKRSLFDLDFTGKSVLCISTLEHIGEIRYGLTETETPLDALNQLIREADRFLVTVPYGWTSNPRFKAMEDVLLKEFQEPSRDDLRVYVLSRRADETWCPSKDLRPYGRPPKPWANSIIVVEKGGLL